MSVYPPYDPKNIQGMPAGELTDRARLIRREIMTLTEALCPLEHEITRRYKLYHPKED